MGLLDIVGNTINLVDGNIRAKRKELRDNLKDILTICSDSIESEPSSDKGQLLHEKVKSLYDNTSDLFGSSLTPIQHEILKEALASTRIFYWLKEIERTKNKVLVNFMEELAFSSVNNVVELLKKQPSCEEKLSPSGAVAIQMVLKTNDNWGEAVVIPAKNECLRSIANLESMIFSI